LLLLWVSLDYAFSSRRDEAHRKQNRSAKRYLARDTKTIAFRKPTEYAFPSAQFAFPGAAMKLPHAAALTLFLCLPLAAQQPAAPPKPPNIPDHFTNLTVLPTTITKPELMAVMKQFAVTFKVRCSYCHAVSDDLSEGSFASDEKPTKEEARKLMRLIHQATLTPAKP
jgi:hypothetical protein